MNHLRSPNEKISLFFSPTFFYMKRYQSVLSSVHRNDDSPNSIEALLPQKDRIILLRSYSQSFRFVFENFAIARNPWPSSYTYRTITAPMSSLFRSTFDTALSCKKMSPNHSGRLSLSISFQLS